MSPLLDLLKDGHFHSGEALGEALGVSRSAVWKQLQQLQAELGIDVHKVRGKGYRLADPVSALSSETLAASAPAGWELRVMHSVDSTNAEALRAVADGSQMPLLIVAEQQTAGRGRRGRPWVSPYAQNLYYSLALRIEGGMARLEGLSLVVGLAVVRALHAQGVGEARLKWPNDILVGDKKLAGILLELVGDPSDVCHVVIGIGINVNMRQNTAVDRPWTSVRLQRMSLVDRNDLVAELNVQLQSHLERHALSGFEQLREEWEELHAWQGRAVVLSAGLKAIEGRVLGIDGQGGLRLSVGGIEQVFSGGELSLRLVGDSGPSAASDPREE
ncbi:bifunctional biotin--[acetyl-CoA-carboxylase] ligase/biotin operon repressor BirA [Pseudomonas baltica]|uniref:Bifunctional ligase/repressor BirA n=1 Tax=Pseudomonas baltica TaxID=2762576 RepID=A0A7X1GAL2_9PSED|nr:bifunctional biotin--[acetyl-CoA-carboxylase] ligase/biotin operon repressor BirA [Pseudomonas baltica]MBC2680724.1 bifunctional biotin--[acetyl-CoA-carboxylase] ligase/biotin operon repressor BirA [Pseudomonas baltica]